MSAGGGCTLELPQIKTVGRYLLDFDPQINCAALRGIYERSTTIRTTIPWLRDREDAQEMTLEEKLADHAIEGGIVYWDRMIYWNDVAIAVASVIFSFGTAYLSWWVCSTAKSQALNDAILKATVEAFRDDFPCLRCIFVDPRQALNCRKKTALRVCGFRQSGPENQQRLDL